MHVATRIAKLAIRFVSGGGGFCKTRGRSTFLLLFFICLLVLTFNCNPMFVGGKTHDLMEISDFSDHLDLSLPLKK